MPETLTVNEELKIIESKSSGDLKPEEMRHTMGEATKINQATGIKLGLVDMTKVTSLPKTFDLFQLAKELPRQFKIALVCKKEQAIRKQLAFAETVAINRGATF
jgi:hypothetical protein